MHNRSGNNINQAEHPRGGTRRKVSGLRCDVCSSAIGPGEGFRKERRSDGQLQYRHAVSLYFDECTAGARRALCKMFCVAPSLPQGTPDTEWLAHAGKQRYVVITRDANITRNNAEMQAIIDHKVKCFILPPATKNTWHLVRSFAVMWGKISAESLFAGPFVWQFDESRAARWRQLYPEPETRFRPSDFSRTPVGHLLNLFADVVAQHDDGWFSEAYIHGLHENIRREIEARISGDRSRAMVPVIEQPILSVVGPMQPGKTYWFDEHVDTSTGGVIEVVSEHIEGDTYSWLIPVRRLRYYTANAGEEVDGTEADFLLMHGHPTGFYRSGFGLRSPATYWKTCMTLVSYIGHRCALLGLWPGAGRWTAPSNTKGGVHGNTQERLHLGIRRYSQVP